MGTLECVPLRSEIALRGFDCGNASINEKVRKSFYPHLLKQSRTYQIKMQNQTVGFYSLSVMSVNLAQSDASIAEFYSNRQGVGAISLDYIAVDARIQNHGIGSTILNSVIARVKELARDWPVRLFILEALRERVSWYLDKGFDALDSADLDGNSGTVWMYFDLISAEEGAALREYADHCCS
ncbi:MAG: hypothetical protein ACLST7_12340 [Oscillospiraceae bacterium]|jgi:GNAT superfamily N-acetyltransferase